jgi:hypothetical protein
MSFSGLSNDTTVRLIQSGRMVPLKVVHNENDGVQECGEFS